MNEQYRMLVHKALLWQNTIEKKGKMYPISVGIVDTGIFPHIDIKENILEFYDCVGKRTGIYDNNGHGTHIAGIIAGNGAASAGIYRGISPKTRIVAVKGLDEKGGGSVRNVVEGIEYLIANKDRLNLKIINISMGGTEEEYIKYRPLLKIVEEAWDRGITVCVAAGNNGPVSGSVTVPGTSKKIITVGAGDDNKPVRMGNRMMVKNYSGKGPTRECIIKPDVLCPGTNIISCKNNINGYVIKSGTSMSTAVMTGIIAIMVAQNPDMTPKEIKKKIMDKGII